MAPQTRRQSGCLATPAINYYETVSSSEGSGENSDYGEDSDDPVEVVPPPPTSQTRRTRSSRPARARAAAGTPTKHRQPSMQGRVRKATGPAAGRDSASRGKKRRAGASSSIARSKGPAKRGRRASTSEDSDTPPPRSVQLAKNKQKVLPPWQELPYHILLDIFSFAAESSVGTKPGYVDARWLVGLACTCQAFAEPALTALYRSPPVEFPARAKGLVKCLARDPKQTLFNYRSKVRCLKLQPNTITNPCDILSVVSLTPGLRHFELRPPSCHFALPLSQTSSRYPYLHQLFDELDRNGIRLWSWCWDQSMIFHDNCGDFMRSIHSRNSFQSVVRLACVNFWLDRNVTGTDRLGHAGHGKAVARAISLISTLTILSFENCTLLDDRLLLGLPVHLTSLTIANCPNVTGSILSRYLAQSGARLRELVLLHNAQTSLCLLGSLAKTCPHLEVFTANLRVVYPQAATGQTNFTTSNNNNNNNNVVLIGDETPTWPASLRTLELLNLSYFTLDRAERYFGSIINASAHLPKLGRLVIHAILRVAWRVRAKFRAEWIPRFQAVFSRKEQAPTWALMSFNNWTIYKAAVAAGDVQARDDMRRWVGETVGDQSFPPGALRRSPRFRRPAVVVGPPPALPRPGRQRSPKEGSRSDVIEVSVPRARRRHRRSEAQILLDMMPKTQPTKMKTSSSSRSRQRRGARQGPNRRRNGRNHGQLDQQSMDGDDNNDDDPAVDDAADFVVQGQCDVVDIQIDNIRPVGSLFTEADFLDDEMSGDEDWDGEDVPMEDGYAW